MSRVTWLELPRVARALSLPVRYEVVTLCDGPISLGHILVRRACQLQTLMAHLSTSVLTRMSDMAATLVPIRVLELPVSSAVIS